MAGGVTQRHRRTAAGSVDSARQLLFAMALHLRAAEPAPGAQEACAALRAARQLGHATLDDLCALVRERQPVPPRGGLRAAPEQLVRRPQRVTAGARRVRVFVVDDHAPVRQGLRAFLATVSDVELVGTADGRVAPTLLAAREPDVVLVDPAPGRAAAAISELRNRHPGTEVVVLTCCEEPSVVRAALAAGAAGYVLKDVDVDRVPAAIRAVRHGEMYLDVAVAGATGAPVAGRTPALTAREREVLSRLVDGSSNREIGRALGIGERTVQTHLGNALTKLGLHSRTQAALWAVREGLARL